MSIKQKIESRFSVIWVIFIIIGLLIVVKMLYLQNFEREKWMAKAKTNAIKNMEIEPNRGDICAADGRVLVSSVPYYSLFIDFEANGLLKHVFNSKVDSLSLCLSKLFKDRSSSQYRAILKKEKQKGNRYFLLKRNVSYAQLKKVEEFPIFRRGRNKGGLIVVQKNKRIKPHGTLASRTIGNYNSVGNKVGLEGAFDTLLTGVAGFEIRQRMASGYWRPLNTSDRVEAKDGCDIITTIDINIQDVAEKALHDQLKKHNAEKGTVVLMEVNTGDIKAIVNLERTDDNDYVESYNFAIGYSTEPGSTFKLASLMVALDDNVVSLEDSIDTGNGVAYYYGIPLKDSHHGGYGVISVKEIFEKSSNVGVSKIIVDNYGKNPKKFVNRIVEMGLSSKLNIDIKGEGVPVIRYPEDKEWSGISLPWMSIGYSIQLTPLQILAFYNAVANNGVKVKPRFVKSAIYHGNVVAIYKPEVLNSSICSKETLEKIKIMLEGVVQKGTATNLKNANFKIAGKTGTSQISKGSEGYSAGGKTYQASFAGYFPADNPKYSCIVVVYNPQDGGYYGNVVAGPVFEEIANKVYSSTIDFHSPLTENSVIKRADIPYSKNGYKDELSCVFEKLGLQIDSKVNSSEWVTTSSGDSCVKFNKRIIYDKLMPNVLQMGLKDAVFCLENLGLKVVFQGRGAIKSQSIAPGTRIKAGDKVVLNMSYSG